VRYIISQIFGAYIACLLVYIQWKPTLQEAEAVLKVAGRTVFDATQFTPNGIPGIFTPYLPAGQLLSRACLIEFINCTVIGIIIWASLDPTNYFIPPVLSPFTMSFAFAITIWGFGAQGLALNTARDLGARFMTMTIWGPAAGGGPYGAIAALTNIPATLFAACIYEFLLTDSDRMISGWHMDFINHNLNHGRVRNRSNSRANRNSILNPTNDSPAMEVKADFYKLELAWERDRK